MNNNEVMSLINQAKSQAKLVRIKKFLKKHSKTISVLVAIFGFVLLVFISFKFYQKFQQKKFSEILHQSLIDQQIGEVEKAKESLKKIHESSTATSGVKSLASLRYAAIIFSEGNQEEASAIYQEVNQCSSCDSYIKEFAGLLAVKTWISMGKEKIGEEDLLNVIISIEDASKQLKGYISEQKAWLLIQRNELEKSYQAFESIAKDTENSDALKTRASEGMKIVISKGYSPKIEEVKQEKVKSLETK
jgi:hypothetical protein